MAQDNSAYNKPDRTGGIYFPELDGLRFFAFLLVFIHHNEWLSHTPVFSVLYQFGWVGVDLFFVLSAFLFTTLLIAEYNNGLTISFRKFYIRRIFRIWPIYFLFIGFCLLLYVTMKGGVLSDDISLRLTGLLTFSDNFMTAFGGYNPIVFTNHLWTISYEEQFYVFIPMIILFLVRATVKSRIIAMVSIFMLFNLLRLWLILEEVPHPVIWVLPVTHFESIVLGIIIGFGGFNFLLKKIKPAFIGLAGILSFIILTQLPNVSTISFWLTATYTLTGISTAMVLFAVLNSGVLKRIFSQRVFVFLGKRSYGLYVYHLFGNSVALYMIKAIPQMPSSLFALFLYSLIVTIILSIASYAIVEKPFLKLKRKFEVVTSRPI